MTRCVNVVNIEYHVYKPCSSNIGVFTPLPTSSSESNSKTSSSSPNVENPLVSSGILPSLILPSNKPPTSEFQARLGNEDLCFFQAIVSCPPSQELTKLIEDANKTGFIPYAYEINQVLLSPTVPQNYSQRIDKLANALSVAGGCGCAILVKSLFMWYTC